MLMAREIRAIIPHCYPFLLPGEELFAMGDRA